MKNLFMICLLGMSLVFGACAHKGSCGGCKDGSCKMEHKDHKDCGCDKKAEDKKVEDKK